MFVISSHAGELTGGPSLAFSHRVRNTPIVVCVHTESNQYCNDMITRLSPGSIECLSTSPPDRRRPGIDCAKGLKGNNEGEEG
eukprot:SAG25_NODE_3825_length_957_cov_0.863636_1_plen_82_part_10